MFLFNRLILPFILYIVCIDVVFIKKAAANPERYAAIVIDAKTGRVLHEHNSDMRRHPASLTKKMTLYMIFDALRSGRITMRTTFPVSNKATRQIPCKLGLRVGDRISVEHIIMGLITKSANDASVAIAEGLSGSESAFCDAMTKKARALKMYDTTFKNASGVPNPGQVSTAKDMATLAKALFNDFPEYYRYFKAKTFNYQGVVHKNHNKLLGKVEGLDGIKTGFTNAAGFNLSASAVRTDSNSKSHRLIAVVMGGMSPAWRDKKIAGLLEDNFRKIGAVSSRGKRSKDPFATPEMKKAKPKFSRPIIEKSIKGGELVEVNYRNENKQSCVPKDKLSEVFQISLKGPSVSMIKKQQPVSMSVRNDKAKECSVKNKSLPTDWVVPRVNSPKKS